MKAAILAILFSGLALFSHAFVVPLSFETKCRDADAVLVISVEKVEQVSLTDEIDWQFKALARCKVESSFKGEADWAGSYIFIPCNYPFDESPCDIEEGKRYVVFLETMGNFSKFGHPLSALCCHEVVDGKTSTGYPNRELVDLDGFEEKVRAVLRLPKAISRESEESDPEVEAKFR